jgi:hypothetical protein
MYMDMDMGIDMGIGMDTDIGTGFGMDLDIGTGIIRMGISMDMDMIDM